MIAATFLELLLSLSLQISLIVGVCTWLVRQRAHQDHAHRLWGVCHIMILVVTLSAIMLPHVRIIPHSVVTSHVPIPLAATSEHWIGGIVALVWALGAFVYGLAVAFGAFDVYRTLAAAKPLTLQIGQNDNIRILTSSRIVSPFCWQIQQPYIVLPEEAGLFQPEELEAMVRHERAHLASGHPLHLFLQRAVEMLFWFHPVIWHASRQAELHRELHCDRLSCRTNAELASYLRSLLRLCESLPERTVRLSAGLRFGGEQSVLRQRIHFLMNPAGGATAPIGSSKAAIPAILLASVLAMFVWIPIDVAATSRSLWSPWPQLSATLLHEVGLPVRDYEIDAHRLRPHELLQHANKLEVELPTVKEPEQ